MYPADTYFKTIGSWNPWSRLAILRQALAAELLRELPGIRVYAAPGLRDQIGVLSFTVEGWDCETLAEKLAEADIALRAGLHCSPLAHRTAGTLSAGTLRVSFSDFSTPQDVGRFFEEVKRLIS